MEKYQNSYLPACLQTILFLLPSFRRATPPSYRPRPYHHRLPLLLCSYFQSKHCPSTGLVSLGSSPTSSQTPTPLNLSGFLAARAYQVITKGIQMQNQSCVVRVSDLNPICQKSTLLSLSGPSFFRTSFPSGETRDTLVINWPCKEHHLCRGHPHVKLSILLSGSAFDLLTRPWKFSTFPSACIVRLLRAHCPVCSK